MTTEEERCAKARKWQRIDDAFRAGDLEALRLAVEDPSIIPNGTMPFEIGSCLVYAIYLSPLSFIRTLLELGADPNVPVDDGFPPLIAALSCGREVPGATARKDVDDVLRLLLSFGTDPNQRGFNDYTPLHQAVADRNLSAIHILLRGGADQSIRTRIDECETPLEMARSAGLTEIVEVLERNGQPLNRRLRSGLLLLEDIAGSGEVVHRGQNYLIKLRLWLHHGEAVRWKRAWGPVRTARLEDGGQTLITEVRVDRRSLVNGLFYGIEGMNVGGTRRLEIAPHLAYGDRGVPEVIPAKALLIAEMTVLESRSST
jgi:hypothetical protein